MAQQYRFFQAKEARRRGGSSNNNNDTRGRSRESESRAGRSAAGAGGGRSPSPPDRRSAKNEGIFGKRTSNKNFTGQTGAGYFSGSADQAYDTIRASKTDIKSISKNTGIKEANIAKVKNHLFYVEHLLDRYVKYGIPAEMKQFDSDLAIASAWRRLELGNFNKEDIQLLKHEIAECWYTRKHGPGYAAAHNRANKRFPAPDLDKMLRDLDEMSKRCNSKSSI